MDVDSHRRRFLYGLRALAVAAMCLAGCVPGVSPEGLYVCAPMNRNPTAYVYRSSVERLREAIRRDLWQFGSPDDVKPREEGCSLYLRERGASLAPEVLFELGNELDFCLNNHGYPFKLSEVYRIAGRRLPLLGWFHLHIIRVDDAHTRVEVTGHDLKVIAGLTGGFLKPHGPGYIYRSVESTSIEEYEILLAIGKAVGEGDMPELTVPGDCGSAVSSQGNRSANPTPRE
jgi:hypothetical protein